MFLSIATMVCSIVLVHLWYVPYGMLNSFIVFMVHLLVLIELWYDS